MRQLQKWLLAASLVITASSAAALDDVGAGKAHYAACVACHGENAQGNVALKAPRLSHLQSVYISAQLQKFRNGQRGGPNDTDTSKQMSPMAAILPDDEAVSDVAAYIASLESPVSAAVVEGDVTLGADYYNQFCGACHGAGGVGNLALNSPRLAGGDDWYLEAQILAFRKGQRGAHPDDKTGRQMRAMAAVLPNEQAVKDVVAYLHSLSQQD